MEKSAVNIESIKNDEVQKTSKYGIDDGLDPYLEDMSWMFCNANYVVEPPPWQVGLNDSQLDEFEQEVKKEFNNAKVITYLANDMDAKEQCLCLILQDKYDEVYYIEEGVYYVYEIRLGLNACKRFTIGFVKKEDGSFKVKLLKDRGENNKWKYDLRMLMYAFNNEVRN